MPAGQQDHIGRKRAQGSGSGMSIGRLRIIVIAHAVALIDEFQPVLHRSERCAGRLDIL